MPTTPDDDYVTFVAEWFDSQPQLFRQYRLKYFVNTNEVELVDIKTKRLFLKRSMCPNSLSLNDFRLKRKVILFGREITLLDYGDEATLVRLTAATAATVIVISPAYFKQGCGKFLDAIIQNQFTLSKLRLVSIQKSSTTAEAVLSALSLNADKATCCSLNSGPFLVAKIFGENALLEVPNICSHLNRQLNRKEAISAVLCASNEKSIKDLDELFFGLESGIFRSTATYDSCTCCIIKPHAISNGDVGKIIDQILGDGYEISALETFELDKITASEFFEVYEGVVPDFKELIGHMITAPCIAMELRAENAVSRFKETAGPWDIGLAKELRPESLRALFGVDSVKSGIYCTELQEDGVTDCQYFFDVLKSSG